jgi:hypothetical protein
MKKHNGMRPQDILILLKILSQGKEDFYLKDLSQQLNISPSEVTESVNRSILAGLIAQDKKTVMRQSLYEFIVYGLPYVFPQTPGAIVPGMPTAHSAPPLDKEFKSNEFYVWPDPKGTIKGQEIEPFHKGQLEAAKKDIKLYELLALTDTLRVGKIRERKLAVEELRKRIIK